MEKNGFPKENVTKDTKDGTPQGGVISPLLANIALDGLERDIRKKVLEEIGVKRGRSLTVIRYAHDVVILHPDLQVVESCQETVRGFLAGIKLKMNVEKTTIIHSYMCHNGNVPGLNYLGFNIRQYRVSKYRRGKLKNEYKTLIKPQKEGVTRY